MTAAYSLATTITTTVQQYNPEVPYNLQLILPALVLPALGNVIGFLVYLGERKTFDCSTFSLIQSSPVGSQDFIIKTGVQNYSGKQRT